MNKRIFIALFLSVGILAQPLITNNVYAYSHLNMNQLLKYGMEGQAIEQLQENLNELGYFDTDTTGYFGGITKTAVEKFQEENGLVADGIVGKKTISLLNFKLKPVPVSRGASSAGITEWSWFGKIKDIISIGTEYKITDVETGKSFNAMRTYGVNHADSETLTQEDTKIMKEIYNNQWSWDRRAIIVDVDGLRLPASMAGMPHEEDSIENGMAGHFDVHFLGSKTHGSNRVDPGHQEAIRRAKEVLLK